MTRPIRVGVCPDFREERWPSMDRVADELLQAVARHHRGVVETVSLVPSFVHVPRKSSPAALPRTSTGD